MDQADPWYKLYWGKIILSIAAVVGVIILLFIFFTAKYLIQIKRGETVILEGSWSTNFSSAGNNNVLPVLDSDREKLETVASPFFGKIMGNKEASISIVAFFDYKCPNSRAAYPIIQQLLSKNANKIKVVYREFPSGAFGSGSGYLSKVAFCAGKQNRFLIMTDILFSRQNEFGDFLSEEQLQQLAIDGEVDFNALKSCVVDADTEKSISEEYFLGIGAGVRGTPTFFVDGKKIEGTVPLEVWQNYIDQKTKK